jgi:hypothetical protein
VPSGQQHASEIAVPERVDVTTFVVTFDGDSCEELCPSPGRIDSRLQYGEDLVKPTDDAPADYLPGGIQDDVVGGGERE